MIAICGEALIDLVDQGEWTFRAHPGGSPANVAVGLARLAIPTALLARVADDGFGRLLRQHLTDNGVDTLADIVDQAALVAAITCSRPGADPPTRDEVTAWPPPRPQRATAGGPGR
jgi:fructokinase